MFGPPGGLMPSCQHRFARLTTDGNRDPHEGAILGRVESVPGPRVAMHLHRVVALYTPLLRSVRPRRKHGPFRSHKRHDELGLDEKPEMGHEESFSCPANRAELNTTHARSTYDRLLVLDTSLVSRGPSCFQIHGHPVEGEGVSSGGRLGICQVMRRSGKWLMHADGQAQEQACFWRQSRRWRPAVASHRMQGMRSLGGLGPRGQAGRFLVARGTQGSPSRVANDCPWWLAIPPAAQKARPRETDLLGCPCPGLDPSRPSQKEEVFFLSCPRRVGSVGKAGRGSTKSCASASRRNCGLVDESPGKQAMMG